jgi:hypothetical protein
MCTANKKARAGRHLFATLGGVRRSAGSGSATVRRRIPVRCRARNICASHQHRKGKFQALVTENRRFSRIGGNCRKPSGSGRRTRIRAAGAGRQDGQPPNRKSTPTRLFLPTANEGQRFLLRCVIVTLATLNCLNSVVAALRPSLFLISADSYRLCTTRETVRRFLSPAAHQNTGRT